MRQMTIASLFMKLGLSPVHGSFPGWNAGTRTSAGSQTERISYEVSTLAFLLLALIHSLRDAGSVTQDPLGRWHFVPGPAMLFA